MPNRRVLSKQILALARPRGALIIIIISLIFVFLERNNENILKGVRQTLHSLSLPLVKFAYAPFGYVGSLFAETRSLVGLKEVVQELQKNYQEALAWKVRSQQLQAENHFLRKQLDYKPGDQIQFITGRVLFVTGHPHQRSITINIGSEHGVKKNDPVVAGGVVVGRIVDHSPNTSTVLLIHDSNLRIPVITKESQIQGIAAGYSLGELKLLHVINIDKVKIGEPVYTTGKGGIYLPNLFVGNISRVTSSAIYIKPGIRIDDMDFVFVLKQKTVTDVETSTALSSSATACKEDSDALS